MDRQENWQKAGNQDSFQGWRLWGAISIFLLLIAACSMMMDPTVEGVRQLIRVTARTSLVLFCLAFTASAAWKRFPNHWTQWQRRNRRYLGFGFATSHAIHAAAIIAFAMLDPTTFYSINSSRNIVPGSIAYVFIFAMAFTSFDLTAAWLGPRAWKILHTCGIYFVWLVFLIACAKRIPMSSTYIAPTIALLCVLIFRIWPMAKCSLPETRL